MGKYDKDAKELLKYIGGKENIQNVTHCVTRMRFVLVDPKLANIKAIEKISSTKGTFTQSGQFQVIIGNDVQLFYNDFMAVSGMKNVEQLDSPASKQQTKLQKIMGDIGEIFAPFIPALICGGIVLGLSNYLHSVPFLDNGTKTLVQVSNVWAQIDNLLMLISYAVFQFLPVAITWSITKKMKTTQILGIVLGLTLISPQFLNIPAANLSIWHFARQINDFQGQVFPAILAGFILVYLERFWRKITPESIRIIVVPLLSLVPAVFLTYTIIGPLGYVIGDYLCHIVWTGLTFQFNWLIAGIFGFVYALLVITGLHHFTIIFDVQMALSFGGTLLWPILALSNIAQGSAVLGMIFLQRKNEKAKQVSISACVSCYLGVSEPALFGVNLKYKFPFVCGLIGSSIAAIISVLTGTMSSSIGVGGIPGILSILPQYVLYFLLAMSVAIVIPFVLTVIVGKRKLTDEDRYGLPNNDSSILTSPIEGKIVLLENVEDQVFSQRLMGDGYAVELTNGTIVSPFDGEVIMTFPTKHAYGLKRNDGLEILIHLGMDTVQLNGNGFECLVEKGDKVKQGDMIASVDLDYVKKMGKSLVSPVIITSNHKIKLINTDSAITLNENILEIRGEENV